MPKSYLIGHETLCHYFSGTRVSELHTPDFYNLTDRLFCSQVYTKHRGSDLIRIIQFRSCDSYIVILSVSSFISQVISTIVQAVMRENSFVIGLIA